MPRRRRLCSATKGFSMHLESYERHILCMRSRSSFICNAHSAKCAWLWRTADRKLLAGFLQCTGTHTMLDLPRANVKSSPLILCKQIRPIFSAHQTRLTHTGNASVAFIAVIISYTGGEPWSDSTRIQLLTIFTEFSIFFSAFCTFYSIT